MDVTTAVVEDARAVLDALEDHVGAGKGAGGEGHLIKPVRAGDLPGPISAVTRQDGDIDVADLTQEKDGA